MSDEKKPERIEPAQPVDSGLFPPKSPNVTATTPLSAREFVEINKRSTRRPAYSITGDAESRD